MSLRAAVDATAAALGIDLVEPGEHAALLALCQYTAERIDAGRGGADAVTELRRALNDLRHQTEGNDGRALGVVEQLRAV